MDTLREKCGGKMTHDEVLEMLTANKERLEGIIDRINNLEGVDRMSYSEEKHIEVAKELDKNIDTLKHLKELLEKHPKI